MSTFGRMLRERKPLTIESPMNNDLDVVVVFLASFSKELSRQSAFMTKGFF